MLKQKKNLGQFMEAYLSLNIKTLKKCTNME
jgi:hypothetical protein